MKFKLITPIILFLTVISLIGCTKYKNIIDNPQVVSNSVRGDLNIYFSFQPYLTQSTGLRTQLLYLPTGTATQIKISIEKNNAVIYDKKIVNLTKFGSNYQASLPLDAGVYSVTYFSVLNETSEIMFLAPTANSPEAIFVKTTLPLTCTVNPGENNNIVIPVIPIQGSIGLTVTPVSIFRLMVLTSDAQGSVPVTIKIATSNQSLNPPASACILQADSTGLTTLKFASESPTYNICIIRNGSGIFQQQLTYGDVAALSVLDYQFPMKSHIEPNELIDDFEVTSNWWRFNSNEVIATPFVTATEKIQFPALGNKALDLSGVANNNLVGGCGTYIGRPATPSYNAIQLDVYGYGKTSGALTIELFDDDGGDGWSYEANSDDLFTYTVTVDWTGWRSMTIPFYQFALKPNEPGSNGGDDIWNPDSNNGNSCGLIQMNLIINSIQPTGFCHYRIDAIRLVKK